MFNLNHHRRKHHLSLAGRKRLSRSVDGLAYGVSILSLFFTLDQVRIIWVEKSADGVSLLSWIFYTLSSIVWLGYGLIHHDRALTITNALWVVFSLFVVAGIVVHQ